MRMGKIQPQKGYDLLEKINEFIDLKKTQGCGERTLEDYQKELNKFYKHSNREMDLNILRDDLIKYFAQIPTTSAAVYNRPYSCLNSFFNYCVRQDYLGSNPLKRAELRKKKDDSCVKSAPMDDCKKLLDSCDKRTFTGYRNYCIILLMLDTGVRTSELVRLEDSDFEGDRIVIRPEVCKTKTSRVLFLSSQTSTAIGKLIKLKPLGWSKKIFPSREGGELDTNELAREFRNLSQKSGVKITPYQLRHTFATVCVENGINLFALQQLMGHSCIEMTRRYTDINQKQLEQQHMEFTPLTIMDKRKRL